MYRTRTAAELGFVGIDEPPATDYTGQRDAWWDNLTSDSQDSILGKARADHLRRGGAWEDLSVLKENPAWRASYVSSPVRDLPAIAG